MLSNDNKKILALGVLLLIAVGVTYAASFVSERTAGLVLAECKSEENDSKQLECIFSVIEKRLLQGDITGAFKTFAIAYRDFDSFSSTGCHRHAHKVGDLVYYNYYLGRDDLSAIHFPQETTACGYGFFHGFLEHLIQDHPDPGFVMKTCEELHHRLSRTMHDIRLICYHGAGHGFTLAHSEFVPKSEWGNLRVFVDDPIHECNALTRASESEREDCRQGVFNVIVDWMMDQDYGFSYNFENPFAVCDALPEALWQSCYYEMAQKLDFVSGNDPVRIADIVSHAKTPFLRDLSFEVGVAGIIQQTITAGGGYETSLDRCTLLSDELFTICVESIVHGLFEHGFPQQEYEKPLLFCAEPAVADRNTVLPCYKRLAAKLLRFYAPEKSKQICTEFPPAYRDMCFESVKSVK